MTKLNSVIFCVFICFSTTWAQPPLYMDIGRLHAAFAPDYYESHEFARTTYSNKYGSNNWIFWPADYTRERGEDVQGLLGAAGFYLALTDFTDKQGNQHEYYHAAVWGDRGPHGGDSRVKMAYSEGFLVESLSKRYRKWSDPQVRVDIMIRNQEDQDVIDPELISEMMVNTVSYTDMGISISRKVYGWSQAENDDYYIVEFVLENNGYVMEYNNRDKAWNKVTRPAGWPQQLSDVWFALCYRFQPSALGCLLNGNWQDRLLGGKGHDAQHIYIGETYRQSDQRDEDSLRALISWDGDADAAAISYDDTGNPHVLTGALLSPQYFGVNIIHADEFTHEKNINAPDDPSQPKTTMWRGPSEGAYAFNQTSWEGPDSVIYKYISSQYHQEDLAVGGQTKGGLDNIVEEHGYFLGFGPYEFEPGEVVKIVLVYAAGGISRHEAIEAGKEWMQTGDDIQKNNILTTGRDSLFLNFQKGKLMYDNTNQLTSTFDPLMPPPPPAYFYTTSGIDKVILEWDGSSPESISDFAGYRIYRNYRPDIPINHPARPADTLYVKLWECGAGTDHPDVVNSFIDSTVTPLWDYRYYLTSFDIDGNESGPYYTLFPTGVSARPSWYPNESSSLSDVMVIPNPAINKARGWGGRRIMFVNLPPYCTIRIYTQSGNLVQEIEHPRPGESPDGDEYWYQDTISNQYVASGVYIYTVESDRGNTTGTLIIIR